jgi:hypothetical protein
MFKQKTFLRKNAFFFVWLSGAILLILKRVEPEVENGKENNKEKKKKKMKLHPVWSVDRFSDQDIRIFKLVRLASFHSFAPNKNASLAIRLTLFSSVLFFIVNCSFSHQFPANLSPCLIRPGSLSFSDRHYRPLASIHKSS